jgi:hypothetical protein
MKTIEEYIHKKSGRIYQIVLMDVINTTNKDDGMVMVVYKGLKKDGKTKGIFVREKEEFLNKFEIL